MAKLHHATAKRAADAGVTMEHDGTEWTATKGAIAYRDENPAHALDAAIFGATLAAEYPALQLAFAGGWVVITTEEHPTHVWPGENVEGEYEARDASPTPPKATQLGDVLELADLLGIDPEEGYDEDEEKKGGSVVDDGYKRQYAEDGHPNNNGDWLNEVFATLRLVTVEGKKTRTDTQALNSVFAENGIITEDHKFGGAFHGTAPRTNGWEGRFRMSGGNMLRKRVADAGFLMAFGEKIEAPAAFCDKYRTKPKKTKKADPAPETTEA